MNINAVLYMARDSLLSEQKAISVTSNNLSNVNTEGYSRQETIFVNRKGIPTYGGTIGQGVQIQTIIRQHDDFIQAQINDQSSDKSRWESANSILAEVETAFSQNEDYGLSKTLNDFWNSWADLANEPNGSTERSSVVSIAQRLTDAFKDIPAQLDKLQANLNDNVKTAADEINGLTKHIAELNGMIAANDSDVRQKANDLYDQRDQALKDLSEYLDYDVVVDKDGNYNVQLNNGKPLVSGSSSWELKTDTLLPDSTSCDLEWENVGGERTSILDTIESGKLKTYIEQRDENLPELTDNINRLAATIVQEVNRVHSAAYGKDGSSGNNFFEPLTASAWGDNTNLGDGIAEATVYDESQLTLHDYEAVFTSPTQFTIRDKETNLDVLTHDLTVDGPETYFEGLKLTFSGTMKAGDSFNLSSTRSAAEDIAVSSEIVNDNDKVAASLSGDEGDNQAALDIAALQTARTMRSGASTFEEYLSGMVGDVGVQKQDAGMNETHYTDLLNHMEMMRENISGVSIDEEMINLMQYQRAYQASAKLITTVDAMMGDILDALKR